MFVRSVHPLRDLDLYRLVGNYIVSDCEVGSASEVGEAASQVE